MSKEIESENKRDIENDHKSDQAGEPKAKRLKVRPKAFLTCKFILIR